MAMLPRFHKQKHFFFFPKNFVIRALTISDIFILSGFGLISPIFSVFVSDNIQGGNLETVGMASSLFLLTKSLGQLPVAQFIDKVRGEKDDFWIMVIGSVATSVVPLMYIFATHIYHIYVIQLLYGFAQALTFPTWLALFTRHIDMNQEGIEWGMYHTLTSLSAAATATIGGVIATSMGFTSLYVIVSVLSFVGSIWLITVKHHLRNR